MTCSFFLIKYTKKNLTIYIYIYILLWLDSRDIVLPNINEKQATIQRKAFFVGGQNNEKNFKQKNMYKSNGYGYGNSNSNGQ